MKKQLIVFIAACLISNQISAVTNKTFFMPRPIGLDNVYENAVKRYRFNHVDSPIAHNASVMPFYQESTNPTGLARFFFPDNKTELVVKDASATGDKDISADWLGIQSYGDAFESKIKIRPTYKSFGAVVHHHKRFAALPRAWFTILLPFVEAQSKLNFTEFDKKNEMPAFTDYENPSPPPSNLFNKITVNTFGNAIEALGNPFFKYGKFTTALQKVAGLADIHLRGGYDIVHWKHILSGLYLGLTIPTSFRPKNEFIGEPVLGNGGHFAIGGGKHTNLEITFKGNHALNIISNLDYYYLLPNTQWRSFDLVSNGPWSRYLRVVQERILNSAGVTANDFFSHPGINFFTKPMRVTPRSTVNFLFATHYNKQDFHLECGYNFWWRDSEKVRLKNSWGEKIGISSFTPKETQNDATIATNRADSSGVFETIPESNLNIKSAAHPSSLSHKVYLTTGSDVMWKGHPFAFYGGGAYEFASSNRTLDQWSLWGMLHVAL